MIYLVLYKFQIDAFKYFSQVTNEFGWPKFEKCRFQPIDAHALSASREARKSEQLLANHFKKACKSELEKARAIYVWICHNITYDVDAVFSGKSSNTKSEDVLVRGSAICGGYARLFESLSNKMGLQCKVISGYSKSGYSLNGMAPTSANHAWNAVKIDDKWYLFDSTWGSGSLKGKKFIKKFSNFYFLCPESIFYYSHFPKDETWLPDYWKKDPSSSDLEIWTKLLHFKPELIYLGLYGKNFTNLRCFGSYKTSKSTMDILFSKTHKKSHRIDLIYDLYNDENEKILNSVMIADRNDGVRVSILFPAKGVYKLDVFGKFADDKDSCPEIFSLKLENTGPGTEKTYPTVYPEFHEYFSPFECCNKYTTFNSMIDIVIPKHPNAIQSLAFTYHLLSKGRRFDNTSMITDKRDKVYISVIFPGKGEYQLDVFGRVSGNRNSSLPLLFSLTLQNFGKGSNKRFPKFDPPYYDNEGTVLHSPLSTPLKDFENHNCFCTKTTKQIAFDIELPGALDAAINPGWNHLTKTSVDGYRWSGSIEVPEDNITLDVKYENGNTYSQLITWS